jgi:hypothetical protein
LTCYSALLYLLAVFSENKTVSPTDAKNMISFTPTGRLEWLLSQPVLGNAHPSLRKLIGGYEEFLSNTDASEDELVSRFMDKQKRETYRESASRFGDSVFDVMEAVGKKSPHFYRLLVV